MVKMRKEQQQGWRAGGGGRTDVSQANRQQRVETGGAVAHVELRHIYDLIWSGRKTQGESSQQPPSACCAAVPKSSQSSHSSFAGAWAFVQPEMALLIMLRICFADQPMFFLSR
jgi:hypothetical protein